MDTERTAEGSTADLATTRGRVLRRNPAALARDLGTTLLVQIPPPAAAAFDLSETGRIIWLLLDPPIDEDELIGLIVDETPATESDIPSIRAFVDDLVGMGAIEVCGTSDVG